MRYALRNPSLTALVRQAVLVLAAIGFLGMSEAAAQEESGRALSTPKDTTKIQEGSWNHIRTGSELEFKGDWSREGRTFKAGAGGGRLVVKMPDGTLPDKWWPSDHSNFPAGQEVSVQFAFLPVFYFSPPLEPEGKDAREPKHTAYTVRTISHKDRVDWSGDWTMLGTGGFYARSGGGHLLVKSHDSAFEQRYPSVGAFPEGFQVDVTVGPGTGTDTILWFASPIDEEDSSDGGESE